MDRLYICHTPYHVLVACEYVLADAKGGESADSRRQAILLMDSIDNFEVYAKRLRNSGLFDRVFTVRHSEAFAPWTNTSFYKTLLLLCLSKGPRARLSFVFDFDEYLIFNDHRDMGALLHRYRVPYHLLEDGRDCFKRFDQNDLPAANKPFLRKILKKVFNVPIGMGDSPYCLDIQVNSCKSLKTTVSKPVIERSKDALEAAMDERGREVLGRVFPVPAIDSSRGYTVLVLTSPMEAHGGGWDEEKQLAYYREVVKKYSKGDVFLKPHPRDGVDYQSLVDSCRIIDKSIPLEVLNLNPDISFDYAVAYLSTALPALRGCKHKITLCAVSDNDATTQGD